MPTPTPTRQILGPLTTSWKQPDGCSVIVRRDPSWTGELWQGQSCQMTASAVQSSWWIHEAAGCFPPRTAGGTTPTQSWFDNWGFYSPGITCPVGWTMACFATFGDDDGGLALLDPMTLQAGETAAGCCPDPYLNKEGDGTSIAAFTVAMPMMQVVWRETDLPASTQSRPSSAATPEASESAEGTAVAGLSEEAKIGIAVGVPLGAIIVLMSIAFFVFVRRHRRRRSANMQSRHQPPDAGTLQQRQYQMHQSEELPAFPPTTELSAGHAGPFTTTALPANSRNN
ncbi:hypothetical protein PG991_011318 [Apiospora marii]|uniref:Uncharacterized protein n=1 Tax=Apiospora marii TaxID=335849 RepID=A0ABR1RDV0_9PEZI